MERLRDLLVKARLVTEAQVREAEKMGSDHNATLAHVLVRGGVIDTQKLAIFLSKKLGLEFAALNERELAPAVIDRIPFAVANRLRVIPIALRKTREGDEIVVAMSDPTDASARREVEHVVKMRVMALVADEVGLQRAINKYYEHSPAPAPPPPSPAPAAPHVGFPPAQPSSNPAAPYPSLSAPAANPAAAFQPSPNPAAAFQPPSGGPHAQGGHPMVDPLRGITLDGEEDDALEIVRPGGEEVLVGASLSAEGPPADFLTESTIDVAEMYNRANHRAPPRPRKQSPLDAIAEPPPPPSELQEHPAAPHLKNSRRIADPREALDGPGDFLTPNTEEHMALVGPPSGGGFSQDLSLDEDTAWLRQRLRGELPSETATAATPPPKTSTSDERPAETLRSEASVPPEFDADSHRPPTLPRDFSGDSSMPSATTPTPPRASGAPTTREVGMPKAATPAKRKRPSPPPSSPLSEEAENPTAAYALDEPTRMDAEGKIGAGKTFDLPSLPSDDDVAAAFDGFGEPPRLETDVALEGPSNAKASLPSDSRAVELSQDAMSEEGPTSVDISALGDAKKRRRRRAKEGPTKVIDYEEVRRKRLAETRAAKETASDVSSSDDEAFRSEGDAPSSVPERADVSGHLPANESIREKGPDPLASSVDAQPTVVVDVSSLHSDAATEVGAPSEESAHASPPVGAIPPSYSDEGPTAQTKGPTDEDAKGATAEETRVTNVPKRAEKTHATLATVDDPATQLDLSLSQMNMCIVCTRPRLRVALGRALRKSVATLYLEESVASATKLGRRTDVDVVALIDPEPHAELSDQLDRLTHRHPDRPLIVVVAPLGRSVRVRRAHLRVERPDDDDALPQVVVDAVSQMLDL